MTGVKARSEFCDGVHLVNDSARFINDDGDQERVRTLGIDRQDGVTDLDFTGDDCLESHRFAKFDEGGHVREFNVSLGSRRGRSNK